MNNYLETYLEKIYLEEKTIKDFKGLTFSNIKKNQNKNKDYDTLSFFIDGKEKYILDTPNPGNDTFIELDIAGNLKDIIGVPITKAEKRTGKNDGEVFYELSSEKGSVTLTFKVDEASWGGYSTDIEIIELS